MPLVPFAPAIIKLNESRIRMEDVNSQQSAGVLTELTRDIARVKARVEAGLNGSAASDALKVSKALATRGADSVDGLRGSVTTWFNFYNNYDPLFTWWMGMPYKQADAALQDYAAFLRDKVAPADAIAAPAAAAAATIPPAPATKLNEVPDLQEIIALPQDEMRAVVQRFVRRKRRPRRARRDQQPWRRTPAPVLPRLARGAADARFRRPEPERPGRLSVHQEDVRAPDRAHRLRPGGQPAAQDRQLRHSWRGARPGRTRCSISPTR